MSRSSLKHQNIIIQESDGKQTYISLEGYSWIKAKFSKVELKRYMEDSGENRYLNLGSENRGSERSETWRNIWTSPAGITGGTLSDNLGCVSSLRS